MKPEELFGLEKDLRKQLESDPEAAFKEIKRLHYPPYDRADKKMKWHMDNMARAVGESNGLPISERLDYMFYLLPEKQTPFVVDDMIRNLDRKELQEVSVWFGNIGPGEAKTEICLRIVERMERLGIERAKILEWIDRLETKDAKARAILMLDS